MNLDSYTDFKNLPAYQSLKAGGVTMIESCTHCHVFQHMMQLSQNLLMIQMAGKMELTEEKKEPVTLLKGHAMLAKAGTKYFFHKIPDPDEGMRVLLVNIPVHALQSYAKRHQDATNWNVCSFDSTPWKIDAKLQGLVVSVLPFLADPPRKIGAWLSTKCDEIYHLLIMDGKGSTLAAILHEEKDPKQVPLIEIMERNYLQHFSLPELAKLAGRSTSVFKREFEAAYHIPPMTWIRQRRLEHARMLIQQYGNRVSEACYTSGFENLSHFSRLYKSHFGESPSQSYKAKA